MKTKDDFKTGAKVTADNQVYGTPNSKSKNGTGDSPNDNGGMTKKGLIGKKQPFYWLFF